MKNTRIKYIIFTIAILLIITTLTKGQLIGLPEIINFSAKQYKGESQNWCIEKDDNGLIYFGNNNGLLQFDGNNWRLYYLPSKSVVRSLKYFNKKLFVGGYNEFGYFHDSADGKLHYTSLRQLLKDNKLIGDIWSIVHNNNDIYFFSEKHGYLYRNDSIIPFKIKSLLLGCQVNNIALLSNLNKSIYTIHDTTVSQLLLPPNIRNNYLMLAFDNYSKKLYVNAYKKGVYQLELSLQDSISLLKANEILTFSKSLNKKLITTNVYTFYANKNKFYYGGIDNGYIELSNNGKQLIFLNRKRGLIDNGVYAIISDNQNNIWLATDNGISMLKKHTRSLSFDNRLGVDGGSLAFTKFNNKYYLATSHGVKLWQYNKSDLTGKFTPLKTYPFRAWTFETFQNTLITNSDYHVVKISNDSVIPLFRQSGIYYIKKINFTTNWLFLATTSGLKLLKLNINDKTKSKLVKVNKVIDAVREIIPENDFTYWLTTEYNGLYRIEFQNDINNYKIQHITKKNGLTQLYNNYIFKLNGINIISNGIILKPLYKTHGVDLIKNHSFESLYKNTFKKKDDIIIKPLLDKDHCIWTSSNKAGILKLKNGNWINDSTSNSSIIYGDSYTQFCNDTVFALNNNGLYSISLLREEKLKLATPIIRKVIVTNNKTIYFGNKLDNKKDKIFFNKGLRYKSNFISFDFVSGELFGKQIEFQTKLVGYDTKWSTPDTKNNKEYTNLDPGEYIFKVKCSEPNSESNAISYQFEIMPEWYQTTISKFLLLLLILIIIYSTIVIYNKRLKQHNKQLAEMVNERTLEIRMQNQGIMLQNEDIKNKNTQITKQSKQLSEANRKMEMLSLVVKETDNITLLIDDKGIIYYANAAFINLIGWKENQYQTESLFNITDFKSIQDEISDSIEQNNSSIIEFSLYNKLKRRYWYQLNVTPVIFDGQQKIVIIGTNINDLKFAQEEIYQQREELLVQSEQLESVNSELEHVNQLTRDSITYAQRIQQAILPNSNLYNKYIQDSFIFYRPRDIVSGDFYWYGYLYDKAIFVESDCTGHGVPGALMATIGHTLLNEIVFNKQIYDPAQILEMLNDGIRILLRQDGSNEDNYDGMDISIAVYDTDNETLTLSLANQFAFLQNEGKFNLIEGDLYTVGGDDFSNSDVKFSNHRFIIEPGDTLYFFSDGYRDQFNEDETEKLKTFRFEKLITQLLPYDMPKQQQLLAEFFNNWKGNARQIDDVLVWGLKF